MNSKKLIAKIAENWPAKMLSIALALVLFVFHRMSTLATRPMLVPLAIETSYLLVPSSSYPDSVRLQLRGEDEEIRAIAEGDIEAYVDFSRYDAEGLYRAPVRFRRKGTALGVEPLEISATPSEISVHLDYRIDRTLPLIVDISGSIAEGFDLVSHAIFPAEIVVSGPLSILENVTEIKTGAINLDDRNDDFNIMVTIINPHPFVTIRGSGMAEFQGQIRPSLAQISPEPEEILPLQTLFEEDLPAEEYYDTDALQEPIEDDIPLYEG